MVQLPLFDRCWGIDVRAVDRSSSGSTDTPRTNFFANASILPGRPLPPAHVAPREVFRDLRSVVPETE
jgi:hypothetical protein